MTTHGHRLTAELVDKLENNLNFIRISMDGVEGTYEKIRGISFTELLKKFDLIKDRIPFGINYVINDRTINDLSSAAMIAEQVGASELLILPEEGIGKGTEIDNQTLIHLKSWINNYQGNIRLSISSSYKSLIETELPLKNEDDHLAFAHIDATGTLKQTSFDCLGIAINQNSVIDVYHKLVNSRQGT
jgi:MoaA/NifB/PqqE/SkfB family radical SAM enzyme